MLSHIVCLVVGVSLGIAMMALFVAASDRNYNPPVS